MDMSSSISALQSGRVSADLELPDPGNQAAPPAGFGHRITGLDLWAGQNTHIHQDAPVRISRAALLEVWTYLYCTSNAAGADWPGMPEGAGPGA